MKPNPLFLRRLALIGNLILLLSWGGSSVDARPLDWDPIDPADLSLAASAIDPDAECEVIFRRVVTDDTFTDTEQRTYIRIKIFDARGVADLNQIDLVHSKRVDIYDVKARTITADGKEFELNKTDIFSREIVKDSEQRLFATSFSPAQLAPGAILEYQWREVSRSASHYYFSFDFSYRFPVRYVSFSLKPAPLVLRPSYYNYPDGIPERDKRGFYTWEMKNVPAAVDEDYTVPAAHRNPWIFLSYWNSSPPDVEDFWREFGELQAHTDRESNRANREVKAKAKALVVDLTDDKAKIGAIYEFCRSQIQNVSIRFDDLPPPPFEKNTLPKHTLDRGKGTGRDINRLFVSLLQSLGYDARIGWAPDRSVVYFSPKRADVFALNTTLVAIKLKEDWSFYDPGAFFLSCGELDWINQDVPVFIPDRKASFFEHTPRLSEIPCSTNREAVLTLSPTGDLSGEVTETRTGIVAARLRERLLTSLPVERPAVIGDRLESHLPKSILTAVTFENLQDVSKPLIVCYHLEVPEYADATGRRLFLQPAVFQFGQKARFSSEQRRHPIVFNYPQDEADLVKITLPEGFSLEDPNAPNNLNMRGLGEYSTRLSLQKSSRELRLNRNLTTIMGMLTAEGYPSVRSVFDEIYQRDNHVLTLRKDDSL